jgi:hypothetical protein
MTVVGTTPTYGVVFAMSAFKGEADTVRAVEARGHPPGPKIESPARFAVMLSKMQKLWI